MLSPDGDRVLVIAHEASRTGAVIQLETVLTEWAKVGREFDVIVRRPGRLLEHLASLAPTTCLTPPHTRPARRAVDKMRWSGPLDKALLALPEARRLLARRHSAIFLNTATHGDIADALPRLPTLTWVHEQRRLLDHLCRPRDITRALAGSTRLAAVSESVRDDLDLLLGSVERDIPIVRPTIDPSPTPRPGLHRARLRESLGLPDGAVLVGACGALSWEKSPEMFLDVARLAAAELSDDCCVAFAWLGEGAKPDVRARLIEEARRVGATQVHFLGELSDPRPFFAALDLYLVTSTLDSFPVAALEAARDGSPIVCFAGAGGIKEFVATDAGVVLADRQAPLMAREVVRLARATETRHLLGEAARQRVLKEYRPSLTADTLWRMATDRRG
ncbi:MAG TPA: glycosyltransferase family 4 protein [Mycobacteriales bacterium]|nr:glycosyltransferase family 4 protein [Mycobacteriales bacterium]